ADKRGLMRGLKGASEEVKQKFLANMTKRSSEAFREEMGFLGGVRVKDVEDAQRKVVEVVQKLAEQGLVQTGDDDEMIE
ncbi:FliG C-terminal domain-containing protein, partial [Campylobacter coli]|uniref:FliG C-terminal domain-containing protein n=1 Tax=Campylobacter coli TaxID=195 RepID=UPI003751DBA3